MGLEKVNFFYSEFKFKIDFFFGRRGGRGWLEQVNNFFAESPIYFFGGWGWGGGGGPGVGRGWRTGGGVGGRTDEQAQAFKCDAHIGNSKEQVTSYFGKGIKLLGIK